MNRYFAILWAAILGRNPYPDCVLLPRDGHAQLVDRIARYERRAAGQRKANETRKAAKLEVLIVGPQEMA